MNLMRRIRKRMPQPERSLALLYHHVGEPAADPWEMSVSPGNFRAHLEVLANNCEVLPLSFLGTGAQLPSSGKPCIFISFDDGYRDNYTRAFPLLMEYRQPATFFIPTRPLNGPPGFWWEIIEAIFFGGQELPGELRIEHGGQNYHWSTKDGDCVPKNWSAWKGEALTGIQKAYMDLSDILKMSPPEEQQDILNHVKKWAQLADDPNPYFAKMTAGQLGEVYRSGLIEIGAHSVDHTALGTMPEKEQWREITESRNTLEALLSSPVSAFAYPYGHYNAVTRSIVQKAGFSIAFTTEENFFTSRSALLELPRIWVRNWGKDRFRTEIQKWMKK